MKGKMPVLYAVVLLVVSTAATPVNVCPIVKESNREINFMVPHKDCDKYYECLYGTQITWTCPEGLFYNKIKRICDQKDDVDCGNRNIPGEKPEVSPGPGANDTVQTDEPTITTADLRRNGCPVDPNEHLIFPHRESCRLYYYCEDGKPELRTCPSDFHFNLKRLICDSPQNAGCIVLTGEE